MPQSEITWQSKLFYTPPAPFQRAFGPSSRRIFAKQSTTPLQVVCPARAATCSLVLITSAGVTREAAGIPEQHKSHQVSTTALAHILHTQFIQREAGLSSLHQENPATFDLSRTCKGEQATRSCCCGHNLTQKSFSQKNKHSTCFLPSWEAQIGVSSANQKLAQLISTKLLEGRLIFPFPFHSSLWFLASWCTLCQNRLCTDTNTGTQTPLTKKSHEISRRNLTENQIMPCILSIT